MSNINHDSSSIELEGTESHEIKCVVDNSCMSGEGWCQDFNTGPSVCRMRAFLPGPTYGAVHSTASKPDHAGSPSANAGRCLPSSGPSGKQERECFDTCFLGITSHRVSKPLLDGSVGHC